MDRNKILAAAVLMYVSYVVRELWTLLPESAGAEMICPFPFCDQEIPKPTHVWIACIYIVATITAFVLYRITHHWLFEVFFYIQFAEFVEFFLIYNNPWYHFYIGPIKCNVNVTNIRFLTLGTCIIIEVLRPSEPEIGQDGQRKP